MSLLAVNHHYYREVSPPSGIYPISSGRLATEVSLLRRKRHPLCQHELLDALADPEKAHSLNTFILTFDDGLKEQMAALHDLEKLGIAALFFVSTAPLTENKVLDVHKLHLIRSVRTDAALLKDLERLFPSALNQLDEAAAARQYRYDDDSARRVKFLLNFVLEPEERQDWINRIFTAAVGKEADVTRILYMNSDDIRILGEKNLLGTHAHNHLPLAQLDDKEMIQDIALSMEILADIGGRGVKGISFPYGGPNAVSDSVIQACASLGLSYGFSMQRGCNAPPDLRTPLRLKRIDCNDVADFI